MICWWDMRHIEGVNSGPLYQMTTHGGLMVPTLVEILVVLNVMDVVLIMIEPTISIVAITPNAKSVTNLVIS